MTRFQVGDRVEITQDKADYASVMAGDTGTITSIYQISATKGDTTYKVEVDSPRMPWINDWGISERNLKLLSRSTLPIGASNSPLSPNAVLLDDIGVWGELIPEEYDFMQTSRRCECGALSVGIYKHSDYCPLYDAQD